MGVNPGKFQIKFMLKGSVKMELCWVGSTLRLLTVSNYLL